ncbi:uncharacterized protein LOC120166043 [Hibiscus syriacus]|uniref:uncharacterized protein LOC120166043 n=1 Tax=Hibiscus syriacus TaxID=106335 RepID=UPI001924C5B9|nr:uncharacterized protein LOC120166043 [Hibiscus syriacus]
MNDNPEDPAFLPGRHQLRRCLQCHRCCAFNPFPISNSNFGNVRPAPATAAVDSSGISIGEALEAAAISVGDKPVDRGVVAAIRAAEARAAGSNVAGLGAKAQAAVNFNDHVAYDYNKITISDVLSDATAQSTQHYKCYYIIHYPQMNPLNQATLVQYKKQKGDAIQPATKCKVVGWAEKPKPPPDALSKLPQDKAVTSEDAEAVKVAELRGRSQATARPGGVADTITKAAKVNMHD